MTKSQLSSSAVKTIPSPATRESLSPVENLLVQERKSVQDRRSELLNALGISLIVGGIATLVLRVQGTSAITMLSFVARGIGLYAAFQLVPFFRNNAEPKLNRITRGMTLAWIASIAAQGLGLAAFSKPVLVTLALADFSLRAVSFAQARVLTTTLNRSAANALLIGSIARLATGALAFAMTAAGTSKFTMTAGVIVVADLSATLLGTLFVEMSLPKYFVSKTITLAPAQTITADAPQRGAEVDSLDIVLDLRGADVVPPTAADTLVDLREEIKVKG